MPYHSLAEFLEELGQAGELVRVAAPICLRLEAAEVIRRVADAGGPAILLGNVEGHALPVAAHLLGSAARIRRALGVESLDELARRLEELVEPAEAGGWIEKLRPGGGRVAAGKFAPRLVKTGPCQQVVRLGSDVDLSELPALTSDPDELGPIITAGQILAADAATGALCVERHALRLLDRNGLALCWHPHDQLAQILLGYRERAARMPVAVVLGGDPAGLLATMAPLPCPADVLSLAGLLRGRPLDVVKCRTTELAVPCDADLVLEGSIDPAEPPLESGPISTPGGGLRASHPAAVVHVTALTYRANPILPAMVPGTSADEERTIAQALGQVFLPIVRGAVPDLIDYSLPEFAAARHWAFAAIRKTWPGQGRQMAHALWALRPLMFTKFLILVDHDVDVHDAGEVLAAAARNVELARDLIMVRGPADPFDPAAGAGHLGERLALDATRKLPAEGAVARADEHPLIEEIRRRVAERWQEFGLGLGDR